MAQFVTLCFRCLTLMTNSSKKNVENNARMNGWMG